MRITSETIRAKVYPLMREAVEAGVSYGWLRAHKHVDDPEPDAIKEAVEQAVMNEICERFQFDGDDD
jgi:hypothetical protein